MSSLTTVLAIMVALEHLYIMFLETIVTSSGSTSRLFGISIDQLKNKKSFARNMIFGSINDLI